MYLLLLFKYFNDIFTSVYIYQFQSTKKKKYIGNTLTPVSIMILSTRFEGSKNITIDMKIRELIIGFTGGNRISNRIFLLILKMH